MTPPTKDNPVMIESPDHLAQWVKFAARGDWACYWTGNLAADREFPPPGVPGRLRAGRADLLARGAWHAQEAGLVLLLQGPRNERGERRYYAVKRKPPVRPYVAQRGLVFDRRDATLCIGG